MQDVTAAIIREGDRVLIARRAEGRHAGAWEFPGGKVEDGEGPEACLAREMAEEFGVQVEVGSFITESIYHYDHGAIRLLAYGVERPAAELKPVDHDQLAWVRPQELLKYDLLPADIPIARFLQ